MILLIAVELIDFSNTNKQLYYLRQRIMTLKVNICPNRMKNKEKVIKMQITKKSSYDIFVSHIVGSVSSVSSVTHYIHQETKDFDRNQMNHVKY